MTLKERQVVMRQKGLCFNCLSKGHVVKDCRRKERCKIESCGRKHHNLLHFDSNTTEVKEIENVEKVQDTENSQGVCTSTATIGSHVCLRIIPVEVQARDRETIVTTYALLDEGSDVTLCDKSLLERLNLEGKPTEFSLTTVNKTNAKQAGQEVSLRVQPLSRENQLDLDRVWSVDHLPISIKSIPGQRDLSKWSHLNDIELPRIDATQVSLLIGSDVPEAFWVIEERRGRPKEPYAIKSPLGWSVLGPVSRRDKSESFHVNFQRISNEDILQQVKEIWESDFIGTSDDFGTSLSREDKRALHKMESSVVLKNGHYEIAMPWRNEDPKLPDNRHLAENRLKTLRKRLEKNKDLHKKYTETVSDYIKKDYATIVKKDDQNQSTKVWYLPHHPVINPRKGKVRVVFDCASEYSGTSLNKELLQGPDQTNSLVGVLTRFRQEPIAIAADIEAMFHQVNVPPDDSNALRFLWWTDGELTNTPEEYQMKVHLFGATSSPSCAGFCLRKTAKDNKKYYGPEVAETVMRNFYVDDCLKSAPDEESAVKLASQLIEMLKRGGFKLTKWLSNSRNVLKTIPEGERVVKEKNLDFTDLPTERTLGIAWDVEDDVFKFMVSKKQTPTTRRGLLSAVSSLYDPLGFAAPIVLPAKRLLQELCSQKNGWDEQISKESKNKWFDWLSAVEHMPTVTVPRCLKPKGFTSIKCIQLHHFADASTVGYGAVTYLRTVNTNNGIHCAFIMGKARVTPLKPVTVPRLELSAGVLAAKMDQSLKAELDLPVTESYFWTDSTSVLHYITCEARRFKTYVANRLNIIHELSSPSQWRHISTKLNPADYASRGIHPNEEIKFKTWLEGPDFLYKPEREWPEGILHTVINHNEAELKREFQVHVLTQSCEPLNKLIDKHSMWTKLQRAVAWLIRYKEYCVSRFMQKKSLEDVKRGELSPDELNLATNVIMRHVQQKAYPAEMDKLNKCNSQEYAQINQASTLVKLTPIIKDGVMRVGGRIDRAPIGYESRHPIILPNQHHLTTLIIRHHHTVSKHAGPMQVLVSLRQEFWIVKGRAAVKRELNKCIQCKKRLAKPETQIMAPLPAQRVTPCETPFTNVGVDYFGPLYTKSGRSTVKRYGCLFTCMSTRAVHLEVAHSMGQDSFLSALLRFIARRGKPKIMFSDNGTNFRGGEKELKESLQKWNQHEITKSLHQKGIEWRFNPPGASHMGGVWERMVRSVKSVLKGVIKEQLLKDESLHTLMVETEKIVNDRPITQISDDVRDPEPLSPNQILLLRPNECLPPGVFEKKDLLGQRMWRQANYLANLFWRRWIREYVTQLTERQKWLHPKRDLKVKDLVLVADDRYPRGQWPLGLVLEVHPSPDNHIRSVKVKVGDTIKWRPISRLCLLEAAEQNSDTPVPSVPETASSANKKETITSLAPRPQRSLKKPRWLQDSLEY